MGESCFLLLLCKITEKFKTFPPQKNFSCLFCIWNIRSSFPSLCRRCLASALEDLKSDITRGWQLSLSSKGGERRCWDRLSRHFSDCSVFSIKAWTISQRFLHTGDSAHRDYTQPMQTWLSCTHASQIPWGCLSPKPLCGKALLHFRKKWSTGCPPKCPCSLDT